MVTGVEKKVKVKRKKYAEKTKYVKIRYIQARIKYVSQRDRQ